LLATVEGGPLPYELSEELDTVGPCDFNGTLPGGFAAHTKLDWRTGDLHAIAYFCAWDHVQHVVIGPNRQVSHTTDIPVPDAPMMHDFALTENHVIPLDLPVTFSMDAVSAGSELPYAWNPAHQARVGLLPRNGSAVETRSLEIDPCFVFHTLNADEDSGRVVVDLCVYDRAYDVATMNGPCPVTLDRWTVDPIGAKVTQQRLDDRHQEFPRIDDRLTGRRHRFGYSAVIGDGIEATSSLEHGIISHGVGNAVRKHDLVAGTVEAQEFGEGASPGEAVFAPASADAGEDDGYVMAYVHDPDRGAADLLIFCGSSLHQRTSGPGPSTGAGPARVPRQLDR
jgi:carotenoid cleavage dioxygenase